jgi:threonine/homoserine/homoserine lactone efflux protein
MSGMFGTQHYWLFLLSGILLNLTPGQDTLYIVGRSIAQGRRAGLLSALGVSCGSVVHTLAAAFGLSAILATSAVAFSVIKFAGATYLVYLGVKMWLERAAAQENPAAPQPAGSRGTFSAAVLTNILNPKVALFYLAFLPQFVDPAANSKLSAFLFLGATFITTGTIWCVILALAAAKIASLIKARKSAGTVAHRAVGTLFFGLGVRLAVGK